MNSVSPKRGTEESLVHFPPTVVARYLQEGVWRALSLAQEFRAVAARWPDRTALICGEVHWSYIELDAAADRRAAALLRLGLEPGGSVLLQVNNTADTVVTWYALLKAGLIPVCTLSQHRGHEIREIGRQTRPVAHIIDATSGSFDLVAFALEQSAAAERSWRVLVQGANRGPLPDGALDIDLLGDDVDPIQARDVVDGVQASLSAEDVAVFQLSGGTTGVPKVIPRLQGEYWYNAIKYAEVLGWTEKERVAYIGPIAHNAGIICGLHGPHSVGAAALIGTPDLHSLYHLLTTEHATDVVLGPFAYEAALDSRLAAVHGLRRVLFSGKKVPRQHFDALTERGVWVGQLFGMGEGLCMITPLDAPAEARATSVGIPISSLDEVRLLRPSGDDEVADGETGELCARGPYTLRGYYAAPEHNARAFTAAGFYRTGDLAARRLIDGSPVYTIEGRIKDLINRGGEKVNAEEIEVLLVRHPAITEAALVAMPDERLGERACAFVVGTGAATISLVELREFLDSLGVAKYKWPERLVWLNEMPRNSQVGKIDKRLLREQATSMRPERA